MRVTARIIANQAASSNVLVVAKVNVQDAPMSVHLLVLTRADTIVSLAAKPLVGQDAIETAQERVEVCAQLAVLVALI